MQRTTQISQATRDSEKRESTQQPTKTTGATADSMKPSCHVSIQGMISYDNQQNH
jgi:hypothetical protein